MQSEYNFLLKNFFFNFELKMYVRGHIYDQFGSAQGIRY